MTWSKEKAAEYTREWRKKNKEYLHTSKRHYHYEKKYGLTWEAVKALFEKYPACMICGSDKRLQLEHNHETLEVRGVLCNYCNMCIGWVERTGLDKLESYIQQSVGLTALHNRKDKK